MSFVSRTALLALVLAAPAGALAEDVKTFEAADGAYSFQYPDDFALSHMSADGTGDVTGVTVHVSSGLEIEASVVGDRFAAWWPSVEPSSDNPDESWTYTVHLADGSTRETDG